MAKRRYPRKVVISSDESDDSFPSPVVKGRKKTSELQRRRAKTPATKKAVPVSSADSYRPVVATHVPNRVRTTNATSAVTSEIEYVVAKVMNKRFLNGRVEYLLEWENWPLKDCTWEPIEHIKCKDLILEYDRREREKFQNPNYLVAAESAIVSFNGVVRANSSLEFAVDFVDGKTIFIPAFFAMRRYQNKFVEYMKANEHLLPKPPRRKRMKQLPRKVDDKKSNKQECRVLGDDSNKHLSDRPIVNTDGHQNILSGQMNIHNTIDRIIPKNDKKTTQNIHSEHVHTERSDNLMLAQAVNNGKLNEHIPTGQVLLNELHEDLFDDDFHDKDMDQDILSGLIDINNSVDRIIPQNDEKTTKNIRSEHVHSEKSDNLSLSQAVNSAKLNEDILTDQASPNEIYEDLFDDDFHDEDMDQDILSGLIDINNPVDRIITQNDEKTTNNIHSEHVHTEGSDNLSLSQAVNSEKLNDDIPTDQASPNEINEDLFDDDFHDEDMDQDILSGLIDINNPVDRIITQNDEKTTNNIHSEHVHTERSDNLSLSQAVNSEKLNEDIPPGEVFLDELHEDLFDYDCHDEDMDRNILSGQIDIHNPVDSIIAQNDEKTTNNIHSEHVHTERSDNLSLSRAVNSKKLHEDIPPGQVLLNELHEDFLDDDCHDQDMDRDILSGQMNVQKPVDRIITQNDEKTTKNVHSEHVRTEKSDNLSLSQAVNSEKLNEDIPPGEVFLDELHEDLFHNDCHDKDMDSDILSGQRDIHNPVDRIITQNDEKTTKNIHSEYVHTERSDNLSLSQAVNSEKLHEDIPPGQVLLNELHEDFLDDYFHDKDMDRDILSGQMNVQKPVDRIITQNDDKTSKNVHSDHVHTERSDNLSLSQAVNSEKLNEDIPPGKVLLNELHEDFLDDDCHDQDMNSDILSGQIDIHNPVDRIITQNDEKTTKNIYSEHVHTERSDNLLLSQAVNSEKLNEDIPPGEVFLDELHEDLFDNDCHDKDMDRDILSGQIDIHNPVDRILSQNDQKTTENIHSEYAHSEKSDNLSLSRAVNSEKLNEDIPPGKVLLNELHEDFLDDDCHDQDMNSDILSGQIDIHNPVDRIITQNDEKTTNNIHSEHVHTERSDNLSLSQTVNSEKLNEDIPPGEVFLDELHEDLFDYDCHDEDMDRNILSGQIDIHNPVDSIITQNDEKTTNNIHSEHVHTERSDNLSLSQTVNSEKLNEDIPPGEVFLDELHEDLFDYDCHDEDMDRNILSGQIDIHNPVDSIITQNDEKTTNNIHSEHVHTERSDNLSLSQTVNSEKLNEDIPPGEVFLDELHEDLFDYDCHDEDMDRNILSGQIDIHNPVDSIITQNDEKTTNNIHSEHVHTERWDNLSLSRAVNSEKLHEDIPPGQVLLNELHEDFLDDYFHDKDMDRDILSGQMNVQKPVDRIITQNDDKTSKNVHSDHVHTERSDNLSLSRAVNSEKLHEDIPPGQVLLNELHEDFLDDYFHDKDMDRDILSGQMNVQKPVDRIITQNDDKTSKNVHSDHVHTERSDNLSLSQAVNSEKLHEDIPPGQVLLNELHEDFLDDYFHDKDMDRDILSGQMNVRKPVDRIITQNDEKTTKNISSEHVHSEKSDNLLLSQAVNSEKLDEDIPPGEVFRDELHKDLFDDDCHDKDMDRDILSGQIDIHNPVDRIITQNDEKTTKNIHSEYVHSEKSDNLLPSQAVNSEKLNEDIPPGEVFLDELHEDLFDDDCHDKDMDRDILSGQLDIHNPVDRIITQNDEKTTKNIHSEHVHTERSDNLLLSQAVNSEKLNEDIPPGEVFLDELHEDFFDNDCHDKDMDRDILSGQIDIHNPVDRIITQNDEKTTKNIHSEHVHTERSDNLLLSQAVNSEKLDEDIPPGEVFRDELHKDLFDDDCHDKDMDRDILSGQIDIHNPVDRIITQNDEKTTKNIHSEHVHTEGSDNLSLSQAVNSEKLNDDIPTDQASPNEINEDLFDDDFHDKDMDRDILSGQLDIHNPVDRIITQNDEKTTKNIHSEHVHTERSDNLLLSQAVNSEKLNEDIPPGEVFLDELHEDFFDNDCHDKDMDRDILSGQIDIHNPVDRIITQNDEKTTKNIHSEYVHSEKSDNLSLSQAVNSEKLNEDIPPGEVFLDELHEDLFHNDCHDKDMDSDILSGQRDIHNPVDRIITQNDEKTTKNIHSEYVHFEKSDNLLLSQAVNSEKLNEGIPPGEVFLDELHEDFFDDDCHDKDMDRDILSGQIDIHNPVDRIITQNDEKTTKNVHSEHVRTEKSDNLSLSQAVNSEKLNEDIPPGEVFLDELHEDLFHNDCHDKDMDSDILSGQRDIHNPVDRIITQNDEKTTKNIHSEYVHSEKSDNLLLSQAVNSEKLNEGIPPGEVFLDELHEDFFDDDCHDKDMDRDILSGQIDIHNPVDRIITQNDEKTTKNVHSEHVRTERSENLMLAEAVDGEKLNEHIPTGPVIPNEHHEHFLHSNSHNEDLYQYILSGLVKIQNQPDSRIKPQIAKKTIKDVQSGQINTDRSDNLKLAQGFDTEKLNERILTGHLFPNGMDEDLFGNNFHDEDVDRFILSGLVDIQKPVDRITPQVDNKRTKSVYSGHVRTERSDTLKLAQAANSNKSRKQQEKQHPVIEPSEERIVAEIAACFRKLIAQKHNRSRKLGREISKKQKPTGRIRPDAAKKQKHTVAQIVACFEKLIADKVRSDKAMNHTPGEQSDEQKAASKMKEHGAQKRTENVACVKGEPHRENTLTQPVDKPDDKKANESAQLTRDCEKSTEKKPTRQFVRDEAFDRFLDELPDYEDANEHAILRELDIRKSDSPITTAKLDIGKSKEEKPTEKIDREKAIDRLFQQQSDDEDEEEHDLIRQLDTQEPEQYMIPGTMKISSSSTLSQPADEEWYEHVSRTYDNRKADHYATPKKINVENLREEKPIGKICPDVAIEHNLNAQSGNKELDKELDEHVSPPQTDIQKPDIRASSGTTGDVKLGEPKPTGNVRSDMAINHTLGAPEPVEIDHEIHSLLPSTSRRA